MVKQVDDPRDGKDLGSQEPFEEAKTTFDRVTALAPTPEARSDRYASIGHIPPAGYRGSDHDTGNELGRVSVEYPSGERLGGTVVDFARLLTTKPDVRAAADLHTPDQLLVVPVLDHPAISSQADQGESRHITDGDTPEERYRRFQQVVLGATRLAPPQFDRIAGMDNDQHPAWTPDSGLDFSLGLRRGATDLPLNRVAGYFDLTTGEPLEERCKVAPGHFTTWKPDNN